MNGAAYHGIFPFLADNGRDRLKKKRRLRSKNGRQFGLCGQIYGRGQKPPSVLRKGIFRPVYLRVVSCRVETAKESPAAAHPSWSFSRQPCLVAPRVGDASAYFPPVPAVRSARTQPAPLRRATIDVTRMDVSGSNVGRTERERERERTTVLAYRQSTKSETCSSSRNGEKDE